MEHVSKSYTAGIPALNDVSLDIEEGEFVFIVGDSGSGKSTLIKLLLKELEPTEGTITINGQKLNKIRRRQIPKFRRKIGVVFQDFRLLKDRNIYDNVAFAQKVIGESTRSIKKNVPLMLSMVGLAAKYRSYPKQLSGGEQQRVAIARALINKPKILLADEPTGNLDNNNAWEIMKLMEEINNNGTTVVVVTHNLEIVKAMNKRVITMQKGVIVDDSDTASSIVTGDTYYRQLIEAGVKIYEYTPGFVHAKGCICDDKLAVLGSVNLDYRSLFLHFECSSIFYDSSIIKTFKADILETQSKCRQRTLEDTKRGFFGRLIDGVLRIFAPLL